MGNYLCFLITILYHDELVKCALRVYHDGLTDDCATYPMEPENRRQIHSLLPAHIQNMGPVVAVEQIFDVCEVR